MQNAPRASAASSHKLARTFFTVAAGACSNWCADEQRQPNCGVGRQACDTSCAAPSCDAAARFFVSLRCQVMIVVTGRLAIKRNAREASFQGVGRRRAVARARGPARLRSRGRHLVYGHQRSGIRRARVNVVRSNAQMMGGVPASCPRALYIGSKKTR